MKTFIAALGLFLLPSMASAAFDVNVCFKMNGEGVENALVRCWDEDWGWDDYVGPEAGVRTDPNGCASLRDNQSWWERPDIYCEIIPNGECFAEFTTNIEADHNTNENANLGTYDLPFDDNYCGDWDIADNGCGAANFPSWLRDTVTEVSGFENACAAHDTCYGECNESREECDDDFYADMLATCAGQLNCEILAGVFYTAVDTGGSLFYC